MSGVGSPSQLELKSKPSSGSPPALTKAGNQGGAFWPRPSTNETHSRASQLGGRPPKHPLAQGPRVGRPNPAQSARAPPQNPGSSPGPKGPSPAQPPSARHRAPHAAHAPRPEPHRPAPPDAPAVARPPTHTFCRSYRPPGEVSRRGGPRPRPCGAGAPLAVLSGPGTSAAPAGLACAAVVLGWCRFEKGKGDCFLGRVWRGRVALRDGEGWLRVSCWGLRVPELRQASV